jgi:hypothetical protein
MSRTAAILMIVTSGTLAFACTDRDTPTAPTAEDPEPRLEISDAAHSGGNEHFFFLPPLVSAPTYDGVFDATQSPKVRICEWTGEVCALPLLTEFTMHAGPGSETVRMVEEDEHYLVNWHTDEFELVDDQTYRIAEAATGPEFATSGRWIHQVSGGGTTDTGDPGPPLLAMVSFTAKIDGAGTVQGHYQAVSLPLNELLGSGSVGCLFVDGSRAWFGGRFSQGIWADLYFVKGVEDSGVGRGTDRQSGTRLSDVPMNCNDPSFQRPLDLEWTNGNVMVR